MTQRRSRRGIALILLAALALGTTLPAGATDQIAAIGSASGQQPVVIEIDPQDANSLAGLDGWPQPELDHVAAYVLVEGASGQILAARHADQQRAVASTVKILTALSVARRTDLEDQVTVGSEVEGLEGSSAGLAPGDTWKVEELLDALISRSGNDAAEALARHVGGDVDGFLAMMRQDAAELGLGDITMVSASGLDDDNQLSAHDLSLLARAALADEELRPLLGREQVVLPGAGALENRNLLVGRYGGATGVKTGFTQAAGNSLVGSAERDGRELIAVVLGAGDDPARFDAAASLLDLGFDAFAVQRLTSTLTYRRAGGVTQVMAGPVELTSPRDDPASLEIPLSARVPDAAPSAEVVVGEDLFAMVPTTLVPAELTTAADVVGVIGRAAAEGIYAALRATTEASTLR